MHGVASATGRSADAKSWRRAARSTVNDGGLRHTQVVFFRSRESDGYRLATRAVEEASALARNYMGPEHLLLALLDPDEDTSATRALRNSGAEHDKLRDALAAETPDSATPELTDSPQGTAPTAGAYQMIGRAEGIAAGLGATVVDAEHLLLALLLYCEDSYIAFRIQQAGGSREAAWNELEREGSTIPNVELPPLRGAPLPQQ